MVFQGVLSDRIITVWGVNEYSDTYNSYAGAWCPAGNIEDNPFFNLIWAAGDNQQTHLAPPVYDNQTFTWPSGLYPWDGSPSCDSVLLRSKGKKHRK